MVKKKDLVRIFYIYICLCHVCPAHPCGNNPLRHFIFISEKTGRSLYSVLRTLRDLDGRAFRHLQRVFHNYAECVGMVETGYFKRSEDGLRNHHAQHNIPVFPADNSLQLYEMSYDTPADYRQLRRHKKSRKNVLQQVLSQTKELIDRNSEYPDVNNVIETGSDA